jgi:hypothetical protein
VVGVARRVALAVLGISLVLPTVVAQQRLVLLFIRLARVNFAVLVAIWLLPLLVVVLITVTSRTGRSLLNYVAASPRRRAAWFVALSVYLAALIPLQLQYSLTITRMALTSTGAIILICVLQPVVPRSAFRVLRRAGDWLIRDIKPLPFLALTAGFTFVLANLASWLVFQHIPHAEDSIGQVFQGRIFASGRLALPSRIDDYFIGYFQVFNDGRTVFNVMPFGHSLLLALGTLIRAEWLINPLLGAAEIVAVFLLGKEVYDERTGRIAALLGVASPFLLFMSSEYMNHASALFFLSLFLLFYLRAIRSQRQGRGNPRLPDPLLSGLCLAMALNIRPLTALGVATPVAIHGVYLVLKSRGRLLRPLLLMALPVVLGVGVLVLCNYLTTGSATQSGYEAYGILQYRHPGFGVGFGDRGYPIWPGPHTPARGVLQTLNNFVALNRYLFESPLPGLILVLLLFLAIPRDPADYLLLAAFAALPAAYFFYYFQALCFGPRFIYEGLALLLLLSARGLIEFPRFARRVAGASAGMVTRETLLTGLALSACFTAAIGLPRLVGVYRASYRGVDNRIHRWVTDGHITNAVVFTSQELEEPALQELYGAAFLDNDLDLRGPVVYARDRGDLNYLLMCQFPGRACYLATPDTLYPVTNLDSLRSTPTILALTEAGSFAGTLDLSGYRNILLPVREAGVLVDTNGLRCHTYRNLDYMLTRDRSTLASFAPALAVFLNGDGRTYSQLFEPMRECRDYVAGGCRFVLRFRSENGRCAVYDVQPVPTGQEALPSAKPAVSWIAPRP